MAIAKNKTNYPLEQIISIFSNKEYGNSFNLSKNKYLSVKGVKWEYISKESELPRFDFSGTLNLIRLKDVEISIIGNNDIITYINIHSNRPSKDTFKILRENLKTYKISKLNCEKSSGYSYFYLAEKENNIPIYILK